MDDEELSIMMASVGAGPARDQVDAVEEPKVRLRLNKAACERLIMAPFLLDPVIGQDIRARRDAARSLRLQEAAERKRQAVQKALRTAMVAAKAIARMRSRAIAARAAVTAAKASAAQSSQSLASVATAKLPARKPRQTRAERRQSIVARLRNQKPLVESWQKGSLQALYELEFTAEPQPEPESESPANLPRIPDPPEASAMRDPAAASAQHHGEGMSRTASSLGARTSSTCDYTGEAFETDELVHQFLTLLVSAKRK